MAKVEIYTWATCPFCIRALRILDRKKINYTEYLIDGDAQARAKMIARGSDGKGSVPQVYINDQHLGGYAALSQLDASGELDNLLTQAPLAS